ncbi:MAG: hypothetical protein AAGF28_02215 [Pseudomonadota bacterium]
MKTTSKAIACGVAALVMVSGLSSQAFARKLSGTYAKDGATCPGAHLTNKSIIRSKARKVCVDATGRLRAKKLAGVTYRAGSCTKKPSRKLRQHVTVTGTLSFRCR